MEEELLNLTNEQIEESYGSFEGCTIAPQDHTLREALKNGINTERGTDENETSDENIQEN